MKKKSTLKKTAVAVVVTMVLLASGQMLAACASNDAITEPAATTSSMNDDAALVLTAGADCTSCHGQESYRPSSADHEGRTADTCLGCHKTGGYYTSDGAPVIPHNVNN